MVLSEATWPEVEAFSREAVVLIPTGAVEQHGPHLPLITDTLIVEEVAKASEARVPEIVVLCPSIWLGMSASHLSFSGTLDSGFAAYPGSLASVIQSMRKHRFRKFLVLNGHGGNSDANRLVLRQEKEAHPNDVLAHATYFELIPQAISEALQGPSKRMTHGCEAETSLMLLLKPELVRKDKFRKDGMKPDPSITGLVSRFEELSEEGSIGYPAFAKAETGVKIFHAAVDAVVTQLKRMVEPLVMVEI